MQVDLTLSVNRQIVPDRSIVGLVEGSDPQLKDEVVIVSAHHDHEGTDGTQTFNGADDNASGTVAVIEIAEAYVMAARAGQRPRRSVLFAVFGSEERGPLLGVVGVHRASLASARQDRRGHQHGHGRPQHGGARWAAAARFRGLTVQSAESNANSVNIIGHSRSPRLKTAVEQANGRFGMTLKMDLDNNVSNLLRRSDQWPFIQRGVPAIWFHTGLHPDYHTSNDRPEKINTRRWSASRGSCTR